MGNHLYDENKLLKHEIEGLRERLRAREESTALPLALEKATMAFLEGRGSFRVTGMQGDWSISYEVKGDE